MGRILGFHLALLLVLTSQVSTAFAQRYDLKLIHLGGDSSWISAANNYGAVVGVAQYSSPEFSQRIFVRKADSTLIEIPDDGSGGILGGINDRLAVVGGESPGTYLWKNGQSTLIPFDRARGINNKGTIVGYAPNWPEVPLVRMATGELITPWASGQARAVNDNGEVVGYYRRPNGNHAVLWVNGRLEELSVPGFSDEAYPNDISNGGHVVIAIEDYQGRQGIVRSMVYDSHRRTYSDIGEFSAQDDGVVGVAVNKDGTAVGYTYVADGAVRPFVWTREGGIKDLNDLEIKRDSSDRAFRLTWATDINDLGWIFGTAVDTRNATRTIGFVLVPR